MVTWLILSLSLTNKPNFFLINKKIKNKNKTSSDRDSDVFNIPLPRGVASGWTGWTMSRGPEAPGGTSTKMNPKYNHWFGAPNCSLSMGPRGFCYACATTQTFQTLTLFTSHETEMCKHPTADHSVDNDSTSTDCDWYQWADFLCCLSLNTHSFKFICRNIHTKTDAQGNVCPLIYCPSHAWSIWVQSLIQPPSTLCNPYLRRSYDCLQKQFQSVVIFFIYFLILFLFVCLFVCLFIYVFT